MESFIKGMLLILMILYVVWPFDLMVGPIDDIIVIFAGLAARKKIGTAEC